MSKKIRLKVPATSANLGAGFDAMGIALDLYCYATFKATDGGLRISGCPAEFRGEDNLAARAFRAVEDVIGAGPPSKPTNTTLIAPQIGSRLSLHILKTLYRTFQSIGRTAPKRLWIILMPHGGTTHLVRCLILTRVQLSHLQ